MIFPRGGLLCVVLLHGHADGFSSPTEQGITKRVPEAACVLVADGEGIFEKLSINAGRRSVTNGTGPDISRRTASAGRLRSRVAAERTWRGRFPIGPCLTPVILE